MPPSITQLTYWAISDRLDSMTPLGRDSVPEVYISRSGSSSATATSGALSVARRPPGVDVLPAGVGAAPDSADPAAHPAGRRRPRPAPSPRCGASASSATIPRGAGVPQDVGDLVGAEHEVDRHEHDAELRGGEREHRVLPAVVRQQRQPVALGQAAVGQRVRGPVHRGVELGVGDPAVAGHDGELVRVAAARCDSGYRPLTYERGDEVDRRWTLRSRPFENLKTR